MQREDELKSHCPATVGAPAGKRWTAPLHRVGRWIPFVFPWSSLQRMTGMVVAGEGVTLASGRLDGRFLQVDRAARLSDGDIARSLRKPGIHRREPVCVSLPRNQTLVRHFRVPAESTAEIEAMLPHLLAGELPMSIEHFSWVWTPLPTTDEGFTLVAVYVARNDRLEEFLAPLVAADLNIVGLIPEGWSWAHAIAQVGHGDEATGDTGVRSVLIVGNGSPHLIVERAGRLLFDMPIASAAADGVPDWDGPDFAAARTTFAELLGFALPEPEVWPDALPSGDEGAREGFFFAASVAAAGLGHERLLMPVELQHRTRRRTALGMLADLGRLGLLALLVWLATTVYEDGRTRRYLADLESRILEEAPRVEVLEKEFNAIRENDRDRAGNTEILQVLTSLRRHVKAPIHMAHLNYVQDRGVTLRGGAPASSDVLEMTEQLAEDPLWQGLRVMQLRSGRLDGADRVQFVVEGRLN